MNDTKIWELIQDDKVLVRASSNAEWSQLENVLYQGDVSLLPAVINPCFPSMIESIMWRASINHKLELRVNFDSDRYTRCEVEFENDPGQRTLE